MKPLLRLIIIAGALIAMFLATVNFAQNAGARRAQPQGPAEVRPEFESDSIIVLRIRMAPHEKTAMHELSARLVVWLTDAHLRDTKPDGTATDYRRAAGTTEWVPAQQHAGENLADMPIEFLAVVPKSDAHRGEHHTPH